MDKTMTVSVNGEMQQRRIVDYRTNHDTLRDVRGLSALDRAIIMAHPVPETFEGEKVFWVIGGDCYIVKVDA